MHHWQIFRNEPAKNREPQIALGFFFAVCTYARQGGRARQEEAGPVDDDCYSFSQQAEMCLDFAIIE